MSRAYATGGHSNEKRNEAHVNPADPIWRLTVRMTKWTLQVMAARMTMNVSAVRLYALAPGEAYAWTATMTTTIPGAIATVSNSRREK